MMCLRASGEDVQAAVFVPLGRRRFVGGFVLHQFYGDGAEWSVGEVAGDVGESAGRKVGFAILHFERDWGLAFDFVLDVGVSERNENVVVVVAMHESCVVRCDLGEPDTDLLIFE